MYDEYNQLETKFAKESMIKSINLGKVDNIPLPLFEKEFKEPGRMETPEQKRRIFGNRALTKRQSSL